MKDMKRYFMEQETQMLNKDAQYHQKSVQVN